MNCCGLESRQYSLKLWIVASNSRANNAHPRSQSLPKRKNAYILSSSDKEKSATSKKSKSSKSTGTSARNSRGDRPKPSNKENSKDSHIKAKCDAPRTQKASSTRNSRESSFFCVCSSAFLLVYPDAIYPGRLAGRGCACSQKSVYIANVNENVKLLWSNKNKIQRQGRFKVGKRVIKFRIILINELCRCKKKG